MVVFSASTISLSIAAPDSVWCAISWGCAVDVAIVLAGAISGKGLVAQSEDTATQSVARPKKSKKSVEEKTESVAVVQIPAAPASKYPHECGLGGCTYIVKNAQSVGGHMKAKHPASLGIFEPIANEQVKQ